LYLYSTELSKNDKMQTLTPYNSELGPLTWNFNSLCEPDDYPNSTMHLKFPPLLPGYIDVAVKKLLFVGFQI